MADGAQSLWLQRTATDRAVLAYYVATVLFLLLDATLGLNVRIAFLEDSLALRAAYYGFCLACLALMLWRPPWTAIVAAFESLVALVALIVSFGVRVILASDTALKGGESLPGIAEIVNFLLAGRIAYLAWARGIRELQGREFRRF